MSDTDSTDDKPTAQPEATGNQAPPPSEAPASAETHKDTGSDHPTRDEFQALTGTVQALVDAVAKLVPESRDSTPIKPPWYARRFGR